MNTSQKAGINWAFLIFLILTTQGNFLLKPLGVLFIVFASNKVPFKVGGLGKFYLYMILYSLLSLVTMFGNYNTSYFFVLSLGVAFWIFALIIFQYVNAFVGSSSKATIFATLNAFFYANAFFCLLQLIDLLIVFDFSNPFANQSSGDKVVGFFANSSINLVINTFFIFYFFFSRRPYAALIAVAISFMTSYISGIFIFILVVGYFFMTSSRVKIIHRIVILVTGILFVLTLWVASRSNFIYASDILNSIGEDKQPRKVTSFVQTKSFIFSTPSHFLFGAGIGNFSSRLAFIADGEYVKWYPEKFLYRSKHFSDNHYTLWNANLISSIYERGTSNQPFSVYNQLLGEYGFIGLVIFLWFYLRPIARKFNLMTYGRVILFLVLGYFLLDYWFEYFSVMIIAELMILTNLKADYSETELNEK